MPQRLFFGNSLLYVPAIKGECFENATDSNTSSIILDLEDSIPPEYKNEARECAYKKLKNYKGNKKIILRINAINSSHFQEDLAMVEELGLKNIGVPKIEYAADLDEITNRIEKPNLFVLIESPTGYTNLKKILSRHPVIRAASLGLEDICGCMGIEVKPLNQMPFLKQMIEYLSIVSYSLNIQPIGPKSRWFGSIENLHKVKEECEYLKGIGIRSRTAIHPSQINIINEEFSITEKEVEEARYLLGLFEKAKKDKKVSVICPNQVMQDTPTLKLCQRIIAKYEAENN